MIQYLKTYASTHVFYIILAAIALIGLHEYESSQKALALAEQQEKISETQVSTLKDQIAANDAKAAQEIAALQKAVQNVKTPQQVVQALPIVAPNLPSPATVQADNSISFPKEDVLPLFQDLAQGKEDAVKLAQCQTDYSAEQQIEKQKDAEIKAYKKAAKKGFWGKFYTGLKVAGAVVVGYELGHLAK